MAERPRRERWSVPQRTAAIAAVATVALTAVLLVLAGWLYRSTIAPQRRQPVRAFPAPGIETLVHDGQGDPPRRRPSPSPDPAIDDAKRAVVTEGIAGWPQ